MLAGYIFYKVKSPPKITSRTNLLLWAGSIGLLFIIIFGVWNGELNAISTAFYVSIGHTGKWTERNFATLNLIIFIYVFLAFGFALIWIILSCSWGLASPVNRVLSYRGLWPLSRLTYCTYLIHPVIMLLISFRMEGTVHLNNLFVLTIFLGNAVVSFGVAFFISVFFEAPVIRLLKICFRK